MTQTPIVDLAAREAQLGRLLGAAPRMLDEFAQVTGLPPGLDAREDAAAALPHVQAFIARTDFGDHAVTGDARIWMMNRLALFLGLLFMQRHGGEWRVEDRMGARFLGHFVIARMRPPVPDGAVLDPFAIAHEVVMSRGDLAALIADAGRDLAAGDAGQAGK